jgi:hypothetical protein
VAVKVGAIASVSLVQVGEVVRWRAQTPGSFRIEVDKHGAGAHEVIVRAGEIRGAFLKPGVHDYGS